VVDDGGDEITIELAGHTWEGEVLTRLTTAVEVPAGPGDGGS
jgi:hypothetical protein